MVPAKLLESLLLHSRRLDRGDFARAGIGRHRDFQRNRFIRGDRVYWPAPNEDVVRGYLHWIETLRRELNRRLFLGLFDYECHFACYPPGACYKKHLDAFRGDTNRVLSTVLYLNPGWRADDGGELLLYRHGEDAPFERIAPLHGSLAIFLSEEFPHEVLPARRPRYSLTGWFRVNGSIAGAVDPPR